MAILEGPGGGKSGGTVLTGGLSGFTDVEINDNVSSFIKSKYRFKFDALGPLDTADSFTQILDAAASSLVFDPNSIFYLIYLVKNKVNQTIDLLVGFLDDMLIALDELKASTTPIEDTSALGSARAALLELDLNIRERGAIQSASLSRYNNNVDKFVNDSLAPNVRRPSGSIDPPFQISRSPDHAREALKIGAINLANFHKEFLRLIGLLDDVYDKFKDLDLPVLAIQNSVREVRVGLSNLQKFFDGATESEALVRARSALLEIKSGKAVLNNLATISDPLAARLVSTSTLTGQAAYPADTANPAIVIGTKSAPWNLPDTNRSVSVKTQGANDGVLFDGTVKAAIESNSPTSMLFTTDVAAILTGTQIENFTINAGINDSFKVFVDGTEYSGTLTSGSRTAAQIGTDIEAFLDTDTASVTYGSVADAVDDGSGKVKLEHLTVGVKSLVIGTGTANATLGFTSGAENVGTADNRTFKVKIDNATTFASTTITAGVRTNSQVAADINSITGITASVTTVVKIVSDTVGNPSRLEIGDGTANSTIGFFLGQVSRGESLDTARAIRESNDVGGFARATVDFTRLLLFESTEASVSATLDDINLPSGTDLVADYGIGVDDIVYLRTGPDASTYRIVSFPNPETAKVDRNLTTQFQSNLSVSFVRDLYRITSDVDDLTSALDVQGTGSAHTYLGLATEEVRGQVSGFKAVDSATGFSENFARHDVTVGDTLTFTTAPATTHTVTSINSDGLQLELSPLINNNVVGAGFKIESTSALNYSIFSSALQTWLADRLITNNFDQDIAEINRNINPVIVNLNPSVAKLNDARTALLSLRDLFTDQNRPTNAPAAHPGFATLEQAFDAFTVARVFRIDSLLRTLVERGMDRAEKILLEGRIDDFFETTDATASLGSFVLAKSRSLIVEDFPAKRGSEEDEETLLSSTEDFDPNYDYSDLDSAKTVNQIDDMPTDDEELFNILTSF